MSSTQTPDQPTQDAEPIANTAVAETTDVGNREQKQSFVDRFGKRNSPVSRLDPFVIAVDTVAEVALYENRNDRQMAIGFIEKPSQAVIDKIKEYSYRWNPADRVWTHTLHKDSAMTTRIDAERLYQEVRHMIRQEKGVEAGQEVPF